MSHLNLSTYYHVGNNEQESDGRRVAVALVVSPPTKALQIHRAKNERLNANNSVNHPPEGAFALEGRLAFADGNVLR